KTDWLASGTECRHARVLEGLDCRGWGWDGGGTPIPPPWSPMNPHESPSPIARCRGTMALLLAGPPAAAAGGEPFRARPAYAECALTSPPDAAAILRRAGAPGPAEGQLLLSVCADKTITAPA